MRSRTRAAIGVGIILTVLGVLIYQGISNNLVYYLTPSELHAKGAAAYGASLRLGGQVRPGSVRWNPGTQVLHFVLQDPKYAIAVVSRGLPPSLFRSGAGVVVEGAYNGWRFDATNLMIKHGSDYRAPRPGQTPVPDNAFSSALP